MKLALKLTTLLLVFLSITLTAHAERRALVIGNSAYGGDSNLTRSKADAQAVAQALQEVGFERRFITTLVDLKHSQMSEAVEQFVATVKKGDELVFYFSGHGISTDAGGNFLVPVGAPALNLDASDLSLVTHYQSVNLLLAALQTKQPKVMIVILDACRSYPTRQLSNKTGANFVVGMNTKSEPLDGQLIMYAASQGRSAFEQIDANDKHPLSIFTRVLVEEIKNPAEHIVLMAQRVQAKVARLTAQDAKRSQRPEFQSKLYDAYSFVTARASVPVAASIPAAVAVPAPVPPPEQVPVVAQPAQPMMIEGYEILDDPVLGKGSLARDPKTGLVWQRCNVGQHWNGSTCTGQAKAFTFDQAQNLSQNGWRVPIVRELASLIHCSSGQMKDRDDPKDGGPPIANYCQGTYIRPTLRQGIFPATPETWYWSSSPYVGYSNYAWSVGFYDGNVYGSYRVNDYYVRLVR